MQDERLRGISCFAGIGGLDLALQEDVRTVCYIEWDNYCQEVLKKRMREGWLDEAPIWGDICSFNGKEWAGRVDIVFGGFPCQDISIAGKGAGIKEGTRSGLFFELDRIVGEIQPQYVFLENVSAITRRGFDIVLGRLYERGYDAVWTTVKASDVGAPHRRERWFCLANLSNTSGGRCDDWKRLEYRTNLLSQKRETSEGFPPRHRRLNRIIAVCESDVPDSTESGLEGQESKSQLPGGKSRLPSKYCWKQDPANLPTTSKSYVGRVAYDVPKRVDRLKCLGNAVVPLQGREAWRRLTSKLNIP